MTIRAKLKTSITIILVLLLFSSPKDQNAEEPAEDALAAHPSPFPWISATNEVMTEEGKGGTGAGEAEFDTKESGHVADGVDSTPSAPGLNSEDSVNLPGETLERIQGIMASVEDENGTPRDEGPDDTTFSAQGPISLEDIHDQIVGQDGVDKDKGASSSPEVDTAEGEQRKEEQQQPSELNKSEDSIPSFSEWTKLQLAQRKESIMNSIKNKTSLLEGKNFASPDCGAKVVNSNPESQNPSGVLSSSHDEYMLNRCTTNVWFILELCEPLTIERLTLGNMELFSSNPHEFEVGVSDRYPTRDWIVFGPYFAPDSRNLHSFHLPPNNSTFGKYLRIVVKSHHGHEHYCPLSLLKVYGKSEYEVLESETTHAQDMETEIPGIIEEEMNDDDKPAKNSVLGTATAVVMEMVKKATDVLVSKKPVEVVVETKPEVTNEPLPCLTLWQCVPESESKSKVLRTLSCESHKLTWMDGMTRWCGWDSCHSFLQRNSIGSPNTPEGLFVAIYGHVIIPALCHYKHPLKVCHQKEVSEDLVHLTGAPNETVNGTATLGGLGQNGIPTEGKLVGENGQLSSSEGKGHQNGGDNLPVDFPTVENPNFHLPTPPPPVEEPTQKESVFVRLSNRIKALERNQSLSSGYLEELSQRFKKQNDEIHSAHESFRKTLNESLSKCTAVEQTLRYEVRKLNRNLDTLRDLIWRMELQRSGFFLLSCIQILSTCFLWWYHRKEARKVKGDTDTPRTTHLSPSPIQGQDEDGRNLSQINQRKRSASDLPIKQKKKKKRKDGGQRLLERIPSSLSADSVPLRLPPSPLLSASSFEFVSPPCPPVVNGGPNLSLPPPTNIPRKTTKMKSGISTSDLSETSSNKSLKKKSKLKSFFFGK